MQQNSPHWLAAGPSFSLILPLSLSLSLLLILLCHVRHAVMTHVIMKRLPA